jgi:hypothetical protein
MHDVELIINWILLRSRKRKHRRDRRRGVQCVLVSVVFTVVEVVAGGEVVDSVVTVVSPVAGRIARWCTA